MGLIREPQNIDFTVLDKAWTEEELRDFSAFIRMRKEQRKKRHARAKTLKRVHVSRPENRVTRKSITK